MLRWFGLHLAQTWRQRRRKIFLAYSGGVRIDFTLCVYAQNAQNFMGNSNMHAKQAKFFSPLSLPPYPPPPRQVWVLGPPVGNVCSK